LWNIDNVAVAVYGTCFYVTQIKKFSALLLNRGTNADSLRGWQKFYPINRSYGLSARRRKSNNVLAAARVIEIRVKNLNT